MTPAVGGQSALSREAGRDRAGRAGGPCRSPLFRQHAPAAGPAPQNGWKVGSSDVVHMGVAQGPPATPTGPGKRAGHGRQALPDGCTGGPAVGRWACPPVHQPRVPAATTAAGPQAQGPAHTCADGMISRWANSHPPEAAGDCRPPHPARTLLDQEVLVVGQGDLPASACKRRRSRQAHNADLHVPRMPASLGRGRPAGTAAGRCARGWPRRMPAQCKGCAWGGGGCVPGPGPRPTTMSRLGRQWWRPPGRFPVSPGLCRHSLRCAGPMLALVPRRTDRRPPGHCQGACPMRRWHHASPTALPPTLQLALPLPNPPVSHLCAQITMHETLDTPPATRARPPLCGNLPRLKRVGPASKCLPDHSAAMPTRPSADQA